MEKVELQDNAHGEVRHKSGGGKALLFITIAVLGVCIVALVVVVIALAVVLGVDRASSGAQGSDSDNVCLTDGCIQLSAQISASYDPSVDPCQDFYQFSCGNWLRTNIIEPGQPRKIRLLDGMEQINVFLQKILESGDDGGVTAVRKALDLYASCVNTPLIDSRGAQPLIDLINSTGGWSLIGLDEPEPWNINSTTGFIYEKSHGSDAFFTITFSFDLLNSSAFVPYVSQSGSTTSGFGQDELDAYRNLIVTVLTLLHPEGNVGDFEEAADRIISFEIELTNVAVSNTALRDLGATYNPTTFRDLPQIWPDFDWRGLIESMAETAGYMISDRQLFIIQTPTFFNQLSDIFRNTSDTTLRDYAKWRFVQTYLPYLSEDFRDALQAFIAVVQGVSGELPRTDTCISLVQSILPIAVARPFVEQYVPSGTKDTVDMMIDYVKDAFKNRINELGDDWLDDLSRQRSLEKVDAVTQMVAYPDDLMDDNYVNGISNSYRVDENDYFGNVFRIHDYLNERCIRRAVEGVDKTRWFEELIPTDINAFYSPSLNQFIFLAGILRVPVFNASWPEYFNFGSFGYVIGHELTHGFDDQGQQFDQYGIRRQWWSNSSMQAFRQRQTCFVEQYNNFSFEGVPVDGQLTLGENIADNGGINTAFQAYRLSVEAGESTQKMLPGLPYTPDQLFFLGSGQVWCALYTPEAAAFFARASVHSPRPVRVMGPLMNSEDFARAFNCEVGTPMNPPPSDKCVLW